jgi:hypothetical protein
MKHRGRMEVRAEDNQSSPYKKKNKKGIHAKCQHWGFQYGRYHT